MTAKAASIRRHSPKHRWAEPFPSRLLSLKFARPVFCSGMWLILGVLMALRNDVKSFLGTSISRYLFGSSHHGPTPATNEQPTSKLTSFPLCAACDMESEPPRDVARHLLGCLASSMRFVVHWSSDCCCYTVPIQRGSTVAFQTPMKLGSATWADVGGLGPQWACSDFCVDLQLAFWGWWQVFLKAGGKSRILEAVKGACRLALQSVQHLAGKPWPQ